MNSEEIRNRNKLFNEKVLFKADSTEITTIETKKGFFDNLFGKDDRQYALKKIDVLSEKALEFAIREYELMTKKIPNVGQAHSSYHDKENQKFMYTMKLYQTDLHNFVKKNHPISSAQFKSILFDIIRGMGHLFLKYKIVHRDLKPKNIFLDEKNIAYIADLGVSKAINPDDLKGFLCNLSLNGTPPWMAPEMIMSIGNPDGYFKADIRKIDVFSIGLIALFILDPKSENDMMNFNKKEKIKLLQNYMEKVFKEKISNVDFYETIVSMLQHDPKDRVSIEELYSWVHRDNLMKNSSFAEFYNKFSSDTSASHLKLKLDDLLERVLEE